MSDLISRQTAIDTVKNMRECCDTNDINDYYDLLHEAFNVLPSAQPEIVRCSQCRYAEVADKEDDQDGYVCQFHRDSIWFSGSFCSWAESKENE